MPARFHEHFSARPAVRRAPAATATAPPTRPWRSSCAQRKKAPKTRDITWASTPARLRNSVPTGGKPEAAMPHPASGYENLSACSAVPRLQCRPHKRGPGRQPHSACTLVLDRLCKGHPPPESPHHQSVHSAPATTYHRYNTAHQQGSTAEPRLHQSQWSDVPAASGEAWSHIDA